MRKRRLKKHRIVSSQKQISFATRKLHSIGIKKVRGRDVNYLRLGEISNIYKKNFGNDLESDYLSWAFDKKFCNEEDTIYFIGNLEYNFVKIGYSKNPKKRIQSIQTGCPFPLTILRTEKGNVDHEKRYHDKFKKFNTYGEWFKIEGELSELLGVKKTNISKNKEKEHNKYVDNKNQLDNEFKSIVGKWGGLLSA